MAYGEGADPRNATLVTGQTVSGAGLLLKATGALMETTDAGSDHIALGVSVGESSRAAGGDLDTAAGATVSYYPMGGVLMIQSEASVTYALGDVVYAGAAGMCDKTSSSQKAIGGYVGAGEAIGASGAGTLVAINTNSAVVA